MDKIFRTIVVTSAILFLIVTLLPFIDYLWLTNDQLELLAYDGWDSIIPNNQFIYWLLTIIWLIISVGLFFFIRIARTAFLIMQITVFIASFFWGIRISSPEVTAINGLIAISDGAILVMAYLTSVARCFEKPFNSNELDKNIS